MTYRIHRFDLKMATDQNKLEQFLNGLNGEIVAIVPNISVWFMGIHRVTFLLIVEKTG